MSTQKGNTKRTRSQKYQNKTKFKNDLHDTSQKTKLINSLEIDNVCARCKSILEWKIKYKKYKPLKSLSTCVKCHNKNVKHAYHIMCSNCSKELKLCPKCGKNEELVESSSAVNKEDLLKAPQVQELVKSLPERRRRTFYRQFDNPASDFKTEEDVIKKLKELSCREKPLNDESDECDSDDSFDF